MKVAKNPLLSCSQAKHFDFVHMDVILFAVKITLWIFNKRNLNQKYL
jgi:hypothetical protein